ncbi:4a-hydroxytetrahydrobiopterin dehydratase [Prosthecobacter vanneervenii]|uniref:Putative pterin-4-alpha-carbinolamine dehydratase n=1 Tax=Prosthecobacter vanneervenii TaxID=48466 RepID=A0A7W7Y9E7_9BACT|nr:4a-hydroxytetrahydrobiopterin dehydratase [Prosthecobacter vanneervenii]MBB5031857.1 4a-hydroxytetrahydrobiopterin dehydratase [Prosthecobacter vanneervenii]
MKRELLNAEAIQHHLATLPGWQVEGQELMREFRFSRYLDGIEFVRRVALLAEAMNHHPDLIARWRRVTVRLSTHSAGGITELDFELARQIQTVPSASERQT